MCQLSTSLLSQVHFNDKGKHTRLIIDPIHCRHRHGPDHHCPVSSPADAKAHQRRLMAEAAVSRLKQQQQPKSTSTSATPTPAPAKKKINPTIELMKMKSKAKVAM